LVEESTKHVKDYVHTKKTNVEVDAIMKKFFDVLTMVDENHDGSITVFEYNQNTKRMDPSLDYLAVIELLIAQNTMRIYPMITFKMKKQLVWGDGVEAMVMQSLISSSSWTIVFGQTAVGKSYRYLLGADRLRSSLSVIWVDFLGVKTSNDVLSAVATQLSLSVLSLDDVLLEFQRLLDSNMGHKDSKCSIILDHVDLARLDILAVFIRCIKKCKQASNIAVVVISVDPNEPTETHIQSLQTAGKVALNRVAIKLLEIESLNEEEALHLANYLDVHEPQLLIHAANYLPGYICSMQSLSAAALQQIVDQASSSNDMILESLSDMERTIAMALYYPLCNGVMFHRALSWELSKIFIDENMLIW
jgi:hypothetical protein